MARPMQLGMGSVLTERQESGRVFYNANTEPGSSGSPCFALDWRLVALHHWGAPTWNRGVLFEAILARLAARDLAGAIKE